MGCPSTVPLVGTTAYVTSTTRPTGNDKFAGQRIFELDTLRSLEWDGTGWVIMSEPINTDIVTAAFAGFTTGTPAYATTYHRQDGWVDVVSTLTFGGTPGSLAGLTWTPPIAGILSIGQVNVQMYDASAASWFPGTNNEGTGVAVGLYATAASGTYTFLAATSLTVPFTWTNPDRVIVSGRYRMSSRYT